MQQFQELRSDFHAQYGHACHMTPGRFRLATSPICTGSAIVVKTTGIVAVAAFAARTAGVLTACDHGHLLADQIGCYRRQSIVLDSSAHRYSICTVLPSW